MVGAHGHSSKFEWDYTVHKFTMCFLWAVGVKRSDIQRRVLQFADIKHLHSALCSTVYRALSVARKLYSECYCSTP